MDIREDAIRKQLFKELSIRYGLTKAELIRIWESPFKLMHETIENLDLQGKCDIEELDDLECNFNLPSFAKVYLNKKHVVKVNNIKKSKNE